MYLIYLSEPVIILFLSVLLDQVFGEPENRHHPVAFIGTFIDRMDQYFRRLSTGRLGGTVFVIVVTFIVLSIILIVQYASSIFLALYIIVSAIILKFSFSLRSMKDHVLPVIESIERGDLVTARLKTSMIVRRDTTALDTDLICSAAIETIAEGFVDGVTGPLFYFPFFGVAGAFLQRTVNTFDSMIGYRDLRNARFGWFAARLDTVLNFIPARLGALCIWLASRFRGNESDFRGIVSESSKTESRNGGWPMGSMAIALGIKLEKKGYYVLGENSRTPGPQDVREALAIYMLSFWIFLSLFVVPFSILFFLLVNLFIA